MNTVIEYACVQSVSKTLQTAKHDTLWAHHRCDVYKRVKTKFLQFLVALIFNFHFSNLHFLSLSLSVPYELKAI